MIDADDPIFEHELVIIVAFAGEALGQRMIVEEHKEHQEPEDVPH